MNSYFEKKLKYLLRLKFLLISFALLCFVSCSWYRLALDHADFVILWEVDKYFDITSEQRKYLKPKVNKFLDWIKTEKAKDISATLKKAKSIISSHSSFNEKDVQEIRNLWSDFRYEAISFSALEISQFLILLSPQQWTHHKEKLWESNKEYADPLNYSPEKLLTHRKEKIENSFSRFFGSPREDQVKLILDLGFFSSQAIKEFIDERIESQKIYLETVSTQKDLLKISDGLKDWARNPMLLKPGQAGINYKKRIENQNKALVKIIHSLDQNQIKTFQDKVDEFIKVFST